MWPVGVALTTICKRGNSYSVDFYFEGKRRRLAVGKSKKVAERLLKKIEVDISEGRFKLSSSESSIDAIFEAYLAHSRANNAPSTYQRYRVSLEHFQRFIAAEFPTVDRPSRVTPVVLDRYKVWRQEVDPRTLSLEGTSAKPTAINARSVGPGTVNAELKLLRMVFKFAIERGLASGNPLDGIRYLKVLKKSEPRFLSKSECRALLDAADDHMRPIVFTLLNTGLRLGELIHLEWADLVYRGEVIKKGSPTTLYLSDSAAIRHTASFIYMDTDSIPADSLELFVRVSRLREDGDYVQANAEQSFGPRIIGTQASASISYCLAYDLYTGDSIRFIASSEYDAFSDSYYWFVDTTFQPHNVSSGSFTFDNVYNNDRARYLRLDEHAFMPLSLTRDDTVRWLVRFSGVHPATGLLDSTEIEIQVTQAPRIGNGGNNLDYLFTSWGDAYGLPPQLLKAIAKKENDNFATNTFRYEDGLDEQTLQDPGVAIANGFRRAYLLADSARTGSPKGLLLTSELVDQGDSVAALDIDPYSLLRNNSLQLVDVQDLDENARIDIQELKSLNPGKFANIGPGEFTAQVILTSSYGLMQPLQLSLQDFVNFKFRNPQTLLTDVNTNVAWSSKMLRFIDAGFVDDPAVNGKVFEDYVYEIAYKYNGGPGATLIQSGPAHEYALTVLSYIRDDGFWPGE